MRVVTPAITLDVRIDSAAVVEDKLVLEGVAGMLPCETTLRPQELRKLLKMMLQPAVLRLLLRGR
ncbi:MAG: hypothetical protein RIS35_3477 [Pseudomonadota bacterium]|jgi:hypothetical protein